MNKVFFGDCRESMKHLLSEGVKVQTCVTSPPYWGLRDYGAPGQLGLEKTPEEFTANMVEVFRLVRDLLADDGTLWLNLGDSYNAAGREGHGTRQGCKQGTNRASAAGHDHCRPSADELKPKDLIGIPWMVAFALRADGWYLRSDIIWHKPQCMPESVKDRPTKSHEYIFLLSKAERYFYDAAAIMEPASPDTHARYARGRSDSHKYADGGPGNQTIAKIFEHMVKVPDSYKGSVPGRQGRPGQDRRGKTDRVPGVNPKAAQNAPGSKQNESFSAAVCDVVEMRNKRTVWTVPTQPFSGAHFATFPERLIEPCILAGSRPGDIVFDPFFGSGTTGQVAARFGRQWIGCELQEDYEPLQRQRTAQYGLAL